ncbi:hypothetical protein KI688_000811 [Linnemannia hyalina]|uniref:Pirin N-terminal domain-containing protein n=1 Tax=Linnemannia hyalina TaxID=64524 RepID=A0A9P8BYE8_9FUNG|nr:hypothetical protein KI688_000811 [Linnemannia hyalina]
MMPFIEPLRLSRTITRAVLSEEQAEGQGTRVRRSIGRPELQNCDPFLMLDEFLVDKNGGFPDHPHRGFETVTCMLQGQFRHEDFAGYSGVIGLGDVYTRTPTMFLDITMEPHKVVEQNLLFSYTGFICMLSGKTFLGEEEEQFVGEAHNTLTFSGSDGVKDTVLIETKEDAHSF